MTNNCPRLHHQLQNFEYKHHPNSLLRAKKKQKQRKQRNKSCQLKKENSEIQEQSHDNVDCDVNMIGSFSPTRYPGRHINRHSLCTKNTAFSLYILINNYILI